MTKFQEKTQAQVKQIVGQMIGDEKLVTEGKEQQQNAEHEGSRGDADQGIVRDQKGDEQPKDKRRAQTVHKTGTDKSAPREKARDPAARKGPVLD